MAAAVAPVRCRPVRRVVGRRGRVRPQDMVGLSACRNLASDDAGGEKRTEGHLGPRNGTTGCSSSNLLTFVDTFVFDNPTAM